MGGALLDHLRFVYQKKQHGDDVFAVPAPVVWAGASCVLDVLPVESHSDNIRLPVAALYLRAQLACSPRHPHHVGALKILPAARKRLLGGACSNSAFVEGWEGVHDLLYWPPAYDKVIPAQVYCI